MNQMDHQPLPRGFQFSGLACGIKPSGRRDLSLIVTDKPAVVAGVYTKNQIVAAPVQLCRARTPSSTFRAVITNSGNANACTGDQGMIDAEEMCRLVASRIGCQENDVLVMSTGIIGQMLPMERIRAGVEAATEQLSDDRPAFEQAADGILTTDKERKVAFRSAENRYSIAAMAKGAGMIAPNMATMLSVICTDASIRPSDAQTALQKAVDGSFNCASVDGHTSTNDTVLLIATGTGNPLSGSDLDGFSSLLEDASVQLAKSLVDDGEGASHYMAITVKGASSNDDAKIIARAVAASPLVKTAITGGDPNWGRIVSAAGYAGPVIDPRATSLSICGQAIYEDGAPLAFDASSLSKTMRSRREVNLELTVGKQSGQATIWASDLTTHYVTFNSEYTT